MYHFELCDIMFFIKSVKYPDDHFNINDYVTFSNLHTRSSTHLKLKHNILYRSSTNSFKHFYFNRISRLWNSLHPLNLDSSIHHLKLLITNHLWNHFELNFDASNTCSFHYLCPCYKCLPSTCPTNFSCWLINNPTNQPTNQSINHTRALSTTYCYAYSTDKIILNHYNYILHNFYTPVCIVKS